MDALTGLHPDYAPDGRVITADPGPAVGQRRHGRVSRSSLATVYKQLDAPYGAFNHWLIVASTNGIKSDDATYDATEQAINSAAQRDALALRIRGVLNGTAHGHSEQLIRQAFELFGRAFALSRR